MRLEDTIKHRLFRTRIPHYSRNNNLENFVIECKADSSKPVPLCIPSNLIGHVNLIYKKLCLTDSSCQERSTPRALYNVIFNTYYSNYSLIKVKMKDSVYYYAPGVLFTADKKPLFYFAYGCDSEMVHRNPRLFLTPLLLMNAAIPGNPMEKFFMSTIVPYLVSNKVYTEAHYESYTVIEIDNDIDSTFFMPDSTLVNTIPVDKVNDVLSDILADNADVISMFTENYIADQ